MDLVGNIKNIGGKRQERKPAQEKIKPKGSSSLPRAGQKETPAQMNESRVGLLLDVNA
jgi:hypothetical protein